MTVSLVEGTSILSITVKCMLCYRDLCASVPNHTVFRRHTKQNVAIIVKLNKCINTVALKCINYMC